ncbi:hypothetical protein OG21DRAFT_1489811 [Imleria badia]|nr:hypothetical protein OG21DRAFT_1489811 [Imleria badia]
MKNGPETLSLDPLHLFWATGGRDSNAEDRNKETTKSILETMPYAKGPGMANTIIGDNVLLQVSRAVAFRIQGPARLSYPPPGGFSPVTFAIAATKIIQALEEWEDGFFKPSEPSTNMDLAKHLDETENAALQHFNYLKSTYPDAWIATSCAIHKGNQSELPDHVQPVAGFGDRAVRGIPLPASTD